MNFVWEIIIFFLIKKKTVIKCLYNFKRLSYKLKCSVCLPGKIIYGEARTH